jgi:hypothetical protein
VKITAFVIDKHVLRVAHTVDHAEARFKAAVQEYLEEHFYDPENDVTADEIPTIIDIIEEDLERFYQCLANHKLHYLKTSGDVGIVILENCSLFTAGERTYE